MANPFFLLRSYVHNGNVRFPLARTVFTSFYQFYQLLNPGLSEGKWSVSNPNPNPNPKKTLKNPKP